MKLSRKDAEFLAEVPVGYDAEGDGYLNLPLTVVENRDHDEKRWMMVMELVVKHADGRLYRTFYERGLTEYQEQRPFEHEGDEIEFKEVRRRVVETYAYEGA